MPPMKALLSALAPATLPTWSRRCIAGGASRRAGAVTAAAGSWKPWEDAMSHISRGEVGAAGKKGSLNGVLMRYFVTH